jgi:hypothetical protein
MCLMSVITRWNFRVPSTAPITAPSFDETTGICAICSSGWYAPKLGWQRSFHGYTASHLSQWTTAFSGENFGLKIALFHKRALSAGRGCAPPGSANEHSIYGFPNHDEVRMPWHLSYKFRNYAYTEQWVGYDCRVGLCTYTCTCRQCFKFRPGEVNIWAVRIWPVPWHGRAWSWLWDRLLGILM